MMSDPTYNRLAIDANPIWKIAFMMSEMLNDNAPLGWGRYIDTAKKAIEIAREST
jgi:hypothetical protein